MAQSKFTTPLHHPWRYFVPIFAGAMAVFILYGANIVKWRNSPDFGWRAMYESGPNVVADLFDLARNAGLRIGDHITAINGKPYSTFEELFFKVRNNEPGAVNVYTVKRGGKEIKISITNGRLGLEAVMRRSGPLFLLGFVYFMIGALVFVMKPKARESLLFLVQTSFFGAMICYQSPSDLLHPLWLFDVRNFIEVFMPAPMLHLAWRFPKTRGFLVRQPKLAALPYVLSFALFIVMRMNSTAYWNIPPALNHIYNVFVMLTVLFFLLSMLWNFVRDPSPAVRLQSQAILVGIFIGFFIPVVDLVVRSYWNVYLFSDPVIGFAVFLTAFPLSVGFTIVKYDLFAIDTVIKRTYGYLLTTGTVAGLYALMVSLSNVTFGRMEASKSPIFPVVFALAVIFFFNPVRNRVQKFIDRVFYRLEYDYQKTVHSISETMRTLLGLNEIGKRIMDFALGTMFIDSGSLMILNRDKKQYECLVRSGDDEAAKETEENAPPLHWPADDPLVQKMAERKKELTIYDIQRDPSFEAERDSYEQAIEQFGATLLVPLIYEDALTGLMFLGRKKSGKFYRREDINLLETLANQGAVAIENARMIEEVIEKQRMEEELGIARDLQMSMLPSSCPKTKGLDIAARSIPAMEVGGDFFDFIDMSEEKIGVIVGDVTGKSVSGALVMAASRSVFRMLTEQALSIGRIMSLANRRTKKDIKAGMFVALLYAVIDGEKRSICFSSAGQTQPVHLSARTGEAILLEAEGDTFPLGILEEVEYRETSIDLEPGDKGVFYTDGIVEAMNPAKEIFGFDRLLEVVRNSSADTAEEMLQRILAQVNAFVSEADQHDDLTVIVVSAVG